MARIAVIIMAKEPQAGAVKTRLCPPLSAPEASHLYTCFLRDKIEQVRTLQGVDPILAYDPASAQTYFATLADDFRLIAQQGDDLSSRLINVFQQVFSRGYDGVVATDSDSPTLPTAFLQQAIEALSVSQDDVVIGPSDDGGYYLIGLRQPHRMLFEDMPWSTSAVYAETQRRATRAALRVAALPTWFDIDTETDLERLRHQLNELGETAPRHTRQYFRSST